MEIVRKVVDNKIPKNDDSQDEAAEALVEFIPEIPRIFVVKDCFFCTDPVRYQILPFEQKGFLRGHYVKIDGKNNVYNVTANATSGDSKAVFKIINAVDYQNNQEVEIVESVFHRQMCIAIVNDKVVVKTCSKAPHLYTSIKEILTLDPEILLVKTPLADRSLYFTYRLYSSSGSKSQYLGFGLNGKPLKPSTVNARQDVAKFSVIEHGI